MCVTCINDFQNAKLVVRVTSSLNHIKMTDTSKQAKVEKKRIAAG